MCAAKYTGEITRRHPTCGGRSASSELIVSGFTHSRCFTAVLKSSINIDFKLPRHHLSREVMTCLYPTFPLTSHTTSHTLVQQPLLYTPHHPAARAMIPADTTTTATKLSPFLAPPHRSPAPSLPRSNSHFHKPSTSSQTPSNSLATTSLLFSPTPHYLSA